MARRDKIVVKFQALHLPGPIAEKGEKVLYLLRSLCRLHRGPHATFAATPGTKAANWCSSALTAPVRQPSAIDWDAGSGKISSSPFSNPSKMPSAADSGEAFGISFLLSPGLTKLG
jgi:hypothetical protein